MGESQRRLRASKTLLLALLLAAFALRLFRLDAQSIWWDEGISLHLATATLAEIFADRVVNIHPPLYFIGLKGWTTLAGVSVFSGRYLSALASLLQVAAVYALCCRWFNQKIAWIAAVLVAISPLSVIYGQEIRVYAMLPLVYLALLALTHRLIHEERFSKLFYISLGVAAWIGLHLHYIVFFVVAYISAWALLLFYRQRRWPAIRLWIITHLLVALASLPWLLAVLANWPAVQREANAGTYLTEPVPLDFLVKQVFVFHNVGLAGALSRPAVWWLAACALVLLIALWVWRVVARETRPAAITLLLQWLVPISSALFVWSVRSFSHPRYTSFAAIGLILLASYLIYPPPGRGRGRRGPYLALSATFLIVLATLSLTGLYFYFFDSQFTKDDVRGTAHFLQANATPDDLIVVPDTDWSLPFEFQGETPIVMPGLPDMERMWRNWSRWTTIPGTVYSVHYRGGDRDWQNVVPFVLEAAGSLVREFYRDTLIVREYHLDRPVSPPTLSPGAASFGPLQLTGMWVEPEPAADTAVTAALQWHLPGAGERYRVQLRLLDADGFVVAETNSLLLDQYGRPTDLWPPGHSVTTYHVIPLPPGTPPTPHRLEASVFVVEPEGMYSLDLVDAAGSPGGQNLVLAEVVLAPPASPPRSAYGVENPVPPFFPEAVTLGDNLRLVGALVGPLRVRPGESLFAHLQWQAVGRLSALTPHLALRQAGTEIAAAESSATLSYYPPEQWAVGDLVNEHRHLRVPPDVQGMATLLVIVGQEQYELQTIEISGHISQMTLPSLTYSMDVTFGNVIRLVGYDLPAGPFEPGEPVPLTLYWQSLQSGIETEYTVFTHLLAAGGRLIGQHDSPPANGQRPTTGWIADEYIIDHHPMAFREPYSGIVRIEVGLYDPLTNTRLLTQDGQSFVYLPVQLELP